MEAQELRQFTVDELTTRVRQWKDELFRAKIKAHTSETKDTSVFRKLKRDIARALTVLTEKQSGITVTAKTATKPAQAETQTPTDKPARKKPRAKGVTANE